MVMAAAMGGPPRRSDGPEVAATTMAGVTIAIGALTQWGEAPQLAAFFIWAKRACRLLALFGPERPGWPYQFTGGKADLPTVRPDFRNDPGHPV